MYFFDYQIMEIIYIATRKKPKSIKGKYFIISLEDLLSDFPLYVLTQPNQIIINIILNAYLRYLSN